MSEREPLTASLPPGGERAPLGALPAAARGFTFMELLVVMAVMAVFFGMGIGYLFNIGRSAQSMQAANKVTEGASRCQNLSAGSRRATLEIRQRKNPRGDDELVAVTAVQRPILTANFEPPPKGQPQLEWFVNAAGAPDTAKPVGSVKIEDDGRSAVVFGRGGYLDMGTRSGFAVTDGLLVDCWVKPAGGGGTMRLLQSDHSPQTFWLLSLVKPSGTGPDAYQVDFRLWLVPAEAEGIATNSAEIFLTKDACVPAGQWTHVEASFDGHDASVRVQGVEKLVREKRKAPVAGEAGAPLRRFAATSDGVAHITLSAPGNSYVGSVYSLEVSGIFRGPDDVQRLGGGIEVLRPGLPIRVVYSNGRLDPTVHATDVVILLATPSDVTSGAAYEVRLGLYGSIPPVRRVLAGPPAAGPGPTPPSRTPAPGEPPAKAPGGGK